LIVSVEELGLAALFALAFANGANDAGKSVASLMMPGPSGSPPKRRALLWGGFFTGVGSVTAILISGRLFSVFTRRVFYARRLSPPLSWRPLLAQHCGFSRPRFFASQFPQHTQLLAPLFCWPSICSECQESSGVSCCTG